MVISFHFISFHPDTSIDPILTPFFGLDYNRPAQRTRALDSEGSDANLIIRKHL